LAVRGLAGRITAGVRERGKKLKRRRRRTRSEK